MTIGSELASAALVGALYAALFVAMELWGRRSSVAREITRKGVHIGGGLIALALPALFASHWTVLALSALYTIALLVARRRELLPSVHGVARVTYGEVIYPAAIYLTLLVTTLVDRPTYYVAAILALAVGDGLAGLVGERFARRRYRVFGSTKSLEGSGVFLIACTVIVATTLVVSDAYSWAHAVLLALLVASIVTVVEGLSTHGLDNVSVPLATCGLLLLGEEMSSAAIAIALGGVVAALAPFALSVAAGARRRSAGPGSGVGGVGASDGRERCPDAPRSGSRRRDRSDSRGRGPGASDGGDRELDAPGGGDDGIGPSDGGDHGSHEGQEAEHGRHGENDGSGRGDTLAARHRNESGGRGG